MDAHANFAYGTVLTPPSPATSGTSLVLNSGQGATMPTPPFNVTIWPASSIPTSTTAEIGRCTAISGDTVTIIRAQEGTSARTIVVGDQVALAVTAKVLTDIETVATAGQTTANAAAVKANNLSDLASASAARTNLGLGTAATHPVGDFAQTANNLSDLASASTARSNLGLGTMATQASSGYYAVTVTLDAIAAPTADVSFNSHKGTNQLDPTSAQDSATKKYVDNRVGKISLAPAGALAETFSRTGQPISSQGVLSTQRLSMVAIDLAIGTTITSITFIAGSTSLSGGNHQIFGLYDDALGSTSGTARALLRGTSDDTSTAWASTTAKTLNLTSTYTTTRSGLFYLGILVDATTVPNLQSSASSVAAVMSIAPILVGTSSTGVTALPNPAAAITSTVIMIYAYVS